MASPTASPTTNRKIPAASSTPVPGASSKAAATTNVANRSLKEPTPSGAPLEGAPAYDFNLNLNAAYLLLQENKPEEARRLFEEIQTQLKGTRVRKDSLNPIHCSLGLALTYPEGNPERSKHAVEVYDAIKIVWATKVLWNNLTPEKKSEAYCALRHCLKKFQPLIPQDQDLVRREMVGKIAECSKHILPLENFDEKVQEAARHIYKKEIKEACALYVEALQLIEGNDTLDYLAPRINCLLSYVKICDPSEKEALSQRAKTAVFRLYDARRSFYTDDASEKKKFIEQLQDVLTELSTLFPDTSSADYLEIQAHIEACKKGLPADVALTAAALDAIKKLKTAFNALYTGKTDEAIRLFLETKSFLESNPQPQYELPIYCLLGLAESFPADHANRSEYVEAAYAGLVFIWTDQVKNWESSPRREKSMAFNRFQYLLNSLRLLTPADKTKILEFIDNKIVDSSSHMLPEDLYNAKIALAHLLARKKQSGEAQILLLKTLEDLLKETAPKFIRFKAQAFLSLAETYAVGTAERNSATQSAKDAVYEFMSKKEELYQKENKQTILRDLLICLKMLQKLFPEPQEDIARKIDACSLELDALAPSSAPKQAPSSRKVFKGNPSGGSLRIGRIFAVLALAAVAITIGFVFYRRQIVTIN